MEEVLKKKTHIASLELLLVMLTKKYKSALYYYSHASPWLCGNDQSS